MKMMLRLCYEDGAIGTSHGSSVCVGREQLNIHPYFILRGLPDNADMYYTLHLTRMLSWFCQNKGKVFAICCLVRRD